MTGVLDGNLDLVLDGEGDSSLRVDGGIDFDRVERNTTLSTLVAGDLRLVRGESVEPAVAAARFRI